MIILYSILLSKLALGDSNASAPLSLTRFQWHALARKLFLFVFVFISQIIDVLRLVENLLIETSHTEKGT